MCSMIKTPYYQKNPPVTIYTLLSNFWISWFTRFFCPAAAGKSSTPHLPAIYPFWVPRSYIRLEECQVAKHPFLVPRSYLRQRSTEELYTPEKYQSGLALCGCFWREIFCKTGRQQQQQQVLQGKLILLSYSICKCQGSPKILRYGVQSLIATFLLMELGEFIKTWHILFHHSKIFCTQSSWKDPLRGPPMKNCWNRHCPNGSHKSLYMRVSELHWKSNWWL